MASNNTMPRIVFLFISLAVFACYIPPIKIFTDAWILPKWYGAVMAMLFAAFTLCIRRNKVSELDTEKCIYRCSNVLIVLTSLECIYVLCCCMLMGVPNAGCSGTYDNPAGLAVSLCISLPFAIEGVCRRESKTQKCIYAIVVMLILFSLLLSKSRTGLICMAIYAIAIVLKLVRQKTWTKIIACLGIGVMATAFVLTHKKDSSSGRFFILSTSVSLSMEHPFLGHGTNGFEREYMIRQAEIFEKNPDSEYAMLADDIHHPLNEFVYVWVNWGMLGVLLVISVFAAPTVWGLVNDNDTVKKLLPSVMAVLVFSLFSYPFIYPLPWIITIIYVCVPIYNIFITQMKPIWKRLFSMTMCIASVALLGYVANDAWQEYSWNEAYKACCKNGKSSLIKYRMLSKHFNKDPYFLYNYAYVLFSLGEFEKSIEQLYLCQGLRKSYNQELLLGDACRKAHRHKEAIQHYKLASKMCPARLAPLEGLYVTYYSIDDKKNKQIIAHKIEEMDIKVVSSDAIRIKATCK